MLEHCNYAMAYSSALIVDASGNGLRVHRVKNNSGYVFGRLLRRYEINMQSVLIRKACLDDYNLQFDSKHSYCPDYKLS